MHAKTVEKVMKHSIVYSLAVTQPFAFYVGAQPLIQDKLLAETEGVQYGENSEIVRHLQYKLSKLGYYEDAIDGVFGLLTEHAIKGFQSSFQLTVTGQADQQTMEMLIKQEKKVEIAKIADLISSISYGSDSMEVRKVQEVLFYYGYYQGSVDGIYGPNTQNAIQQIMNEGLIDIHDPSSNVEEESDAPIVSTTNALTIHNTSVDTEEVENNEEKEEKNEKEQIIQLEVKSDANTIVQTAKSYMDTPYVWGGTSPGGFDCSGFIQFVFAQNNIMIPRTVSEIWNFSTPIDTPAIGDLVFFETYQPGPSHLGIYLGNGDFIHAGSSSGVTISNLKNDSYWQPKYLGAKRIN